MLIRFNVGNFLSFKEVQEFSMLAGKVRSKAERLYTDENLRLLKFAAVFGANASGKSNLILAMGFAQQMLMNGFPENTEQKYFKLNPKNKTKASYFEFEIVLNGKYYAYGFEAILSEHRITSEWLSELHPAGQDTDIFTRDVEKGVYSLKGYFANQELLRKLDVYADDIKRDGSVLFLTILNRNKDTLYDENKEAGILRLIFEWFQDQLDIDFPDRPVSDYSCFLANQDFEQVCAVLASFGTGITRYSMVETEAKKMTEEIPPQILKEILQRLKEKGWQGQKQRKLPAIVVRGRKSLNIYEIDETGSISGRTIQFNHGDNEIPFSLSEESDGTDRLLDLMTVLLERRPGKVYVIDEVDRCLHPQLTYKFIAEYLKAAAQREIQLIVTTHESRLLDFELLRKDEIWFVDKNSGGESSVYSLDEYNERFDKKIDKAYLEGRYGGVPVFSTIFPVGEV